MKQRPRIYYSDTQKTLMWDRWQKGDSLHTIARLFDRGHSSVQRILSETGGIRPPTRSRSRLSLTLAEREEISRGVVAGHSARSIAASLERAASTVSREINRNGGRRHYRANNLQTSMSRRGNCHDNAVAESFFQLLKRERIKRHIYSTRDDARGDVVDYIEMFYNSKRRHGFNEMLSPVEYEKRFTERLVSV